ncbi:MAG: extensin family protein [Deltaproteobacteria bacterium]|nr:extensin family protein [Deltaproteobacteria bacterium]
MLFSSRRSWRSLLIASALALVASVAMARAQQHDRFANIPMAEPRRDLGSYPLDAVERRMLPNGRCPDVPLVSYPGTQLRFARSLRIHEAFVPRVQVFERIVYDAAVEVYGRPPRRLQHRGTYNCRAVRGFPELLSEHGLGNALDWSGADFAALARAQPAPASLPAALRRGFSVTVLRDYRPRTGLGAVHARFFQILRERLIAAPEFSGVLGPGYPGHEDHFHLDVAPWTLSYLDRIAVDPPVPIVLPPIRPN